MFEVGCMIGLLTFVAILGTFIVACSMFDILDNVLLGIFCCCDVDISIFRQLALLRSE